MSEINFCLKCHAVLEVEDIEGIQIDLDHRKFVLGQGTELGFHDSDECRGLVIEIDQALVDEMQDAIQDTDDMAEIESRPDDDQKRRENKCLDK